MALHADLPFRPTGGSRISEWAERVGMAKAGRRSQKDERFLVRRDARNV
jgi:hypothetical protein